VTELLDNCLCAKNCQRQEGNEAHFDLHCPVLPVVTAEENWHALVAPRIPRNIMNLLEHQ
jgi:hypothetical protein